MANPVDARAMVNESMTTLFANIDKTKAKLANDDLDYRDL